MSWIMEVIGPELPELSALELENLPYSASANINQSVPNLATMYMPVRSRMTSIMGQIEPEHPEFFALEFGNIGENDFVHTLSSTNIDQLALNMVKLYVIKRSGLSSIMDLIGPELENLPYLTLFTL